MMSKKTQKKETSYTLASLSPIEWVLISLVTLFSCLAVIVSIDPARRLNEASNAHRFSDITGILDEINDYHRKEGEHYEAIRLLEKEYAYELGTCSENAVCKAVEVNDSCLDLGGLAQFPWDPSKGTSIHSGYYLIHHKNDEVTVGVCSPDREGPISEGPIPILNLRD